MQRSTLHIYFPSTISLEQSSYIMPDIGEYSFPLGE